MLDAKGWPKDEVEVSAAKIKERFTTAEAVAASVGTSSILRSGPRQLGAYTCQLGPRRAAAYAATPRQYLTSSL